MKRKILARDVEVSVYETKKTLLEWRRVQLIKRATEAECVLCGALDGTSIKYKFQHIIAPFIVDFYIPSVRLCIELDGSFHLKTKRYDRQRLAYLYSKGYVVLRFWNSQIVYDVLGAVNVIKGYLKNGAATN